MNPQIRQLRADLGAKVTAAGELLAEGKSAEDHARGAAIMAETTAIDERIQALETIERYKADGVRAIEEEEKETLEANRKAAEAAARQQDRGAEGARGVAQNSVIEEDLEDEAAHDPASEDERAAAKKLTGAFSDLIEELRDRETPEARARRDAFAHCVKYGLDGAPPEVRENVRLVSQIPHSSAGSAGQKPEVRAMGLGSAASLAILVPEEAMREVRLARLAFGNWRDPALRVNFLSTATGNVIPLPTINDTSNQGSYRGEHEAIAVATDVAAKPNSIGAYLLRSGVFKVGYELAQDESFGLESLLLTLGATRNERRRQTAWTTGNGQSIPTGVMEGITSGKTAANAGSFVPTDWYDLFASVDAAYHPGSAVMLSNDGLTKLKIMEGGIGQGLWQPGLAAGQPSMIDGHPFVVNFAMASVATTNEPAIFGDFSWMYIREVVPTVVIRYAEKYAPDIGYEVIDRDDSRLVNPGVVPVKSMTMA